MNINTSTTLQGQMLGRYQLLRLLGRGSMGEVWLADDTQLHRQVAIKMLPTMMADDRQYLEAFAKEARAAAALEHPHILPVHDFGEQQTAQAQVITYLVMPYISGGTLRDRLKTLQRTLPVTESLRYLRHAALAIDYAHSQHVLHRDIKPANMLLQQDWLLLADFGIAKLLNATVQQGNTHAGAGTPEYMAPEQAQGHAQAASDRYSLAVVAYQLFTGRVPFMSESPYSIMIQHVRELPPPPRQLNSHIPIAVEDAIMRGLAKKPDMRPPTCIAFIDALERGWSIGGLSAQPASDADATVLAPWNSRQRQAQQQEALPPQLPFPSQAPVTPSTPLANRAAPFQAATPMQTPPPSPYLVQPAPASMPMQTPPPPYLAPPTPIAAPTQTPQSGTLGASLPTQYYQSSAQLPGQFQLPPLPPTPPHKPATIGRRNLLLGGTAAVVAVASGGIVLNNILHRAATPPVAAKPTPGPHKLIAGIPLLSLTGHSDQVWNAVWHPSGRYLATAGDDTRVMLWDIGGQLQQGSKSFRTVPTPLRQWKFAGNIEINGISWVANGKYLAVSVLTENNKLYLLDAFKGSTPVLYTDTSLTDPYAITNYGYLSSAPNSSVFAASVYTEEVVTLWLPGQTKTPIGKLSNSVSVTQGVPAAEVEETAWSMDGSMLAGSTNDFKVIIWQVKTGAVKHIFTLPDRFPKLNAVLTLRGAIGWSPANLNMLFASDVDAVVVLDVRQNQPVMVLGTDDPHALTPPAQTNGIQWTPNVTGASWSPNGRYIAAAYGRTRNINIWDVQQLQAKAKANPNQTLTETKLFPNSDNAPGHSSAIIDVEWSPNGRYLATASFDKTVIIWQVDGA